MKFHAAFLARGPDDPVFCPVDLAAPSAVAERTLREVYLPHFEAAVKQGDVGTIMCSYNRINGTYACENAHTLQQILEQQWGFKGIVLADYPAKGTLDQSGNFDLPLAPNASAASVITCQPGRT